MIWTATARTMAGWPKFFRKRSYSFLNPSLFSTYQVPVRSAVGELVAHRDPLGRVEVVSFVDETGVILVSLLTSLIISVGADAILTSLVSPLVDFVEVDSTGFTGAISVPS